MVVGLSLIWLIVSCYQCFARSKLTSPDGNPDHPYLLRIVVLNCILFIPRSSLFSFIYDLRFRVFLREIWQKENEDEKYQMTLERKKRKVRLFWFIFSNFLQFLL